MISKEMMLALGGIILAALLFGSGYYVGGQVAEGDCEEDKRVAIEEAVKADRESDGRMREIEQAWADFNTRFNKALGEAQARWKREADDYARRNPAVAAACKLDDDGLRIWNGDSDG